MPNYTQAAEEIKSRCNIVDVIGSLIPLKKTGSNYMACCPFHNEKTPSFSVSEKRQGYHCFGCGEGGDVIKFVQKYYNLSFTEAIDKLAPQYGVTIEKDNSINNQKRQELLAVNKIAASYFVSKIKDKNNPGYKYISERQISDATISEFGLGYAPDEWQGLSDYLKMNGVSKDKILELGLCSEGKDKNKLFDKYRSRLMFPIIDTRGNVIGFGGRIIGDGSPKYLNSSESFVFLKKNNLYGLNKSKDFISKEGYAILVEGYMDMVSLYQSGVKNVVASLGTSLTENQAKLLNRYCKKVILCYDADAAGIKAAIRGIDILRAADMDVKVLHVEGAKDPDEYIKKNGKDDFLRLIDTKALNHVDYKVALISKKYKRDTAEGNIKFIQAIAGIISKLLPAEQEVYIKDLAQRFHISEDTLKKEAKLVSETPESAINNNTEKTEAEIQSISKSDLNLEKMVLRLSLLNSDYFADFVKYENVFVSDSGIEIADALNSLFQKDKDFDVDILKDYLSSESYTYLKLFIDTIPVGDEKAAYGDCITKLNAKNKDQRIREINNALSILDDMPQDDEKVQSEIKKLMTELTQLYRS